jgi:hypothetical protein
MSLLFCIGAFLVCLIASRHSLVVGLVVLLGIGYAYGITRANLADPYSHFIFDAAVLGFYCAQLFRRLTRAHEYRVQGVKRWLELLIAWPLLLLLIPSQDLLIRFVGLRGNVFFLPFILIGARLTDLERYDIAIWLAVLNLGAFAFATTEFFMGLESFFPHNEITRLIYLSKDVASSSAYRIPATFLGSHAYAGSMVMSLPVFLGALQQTKKEAFHKPILVAGIIVSLLGVLVAASRLHFVTAAIIVIVAVFSMKSRVSHLLGWVLILSGIGWLTFGEERLQRFTELQNAQMVSERVVGSVNMGFFEAAATYPFGNGLGGGGTSIPYFLRDRIEKPVIIENEYARILLEQGLVGLALWVAFIVWLMMRSQPAKSDSWFIGRRLAWVTCAAYFATGLIGTGLLTSIPQTCLLLLNVGWVGAQQPEKVAEQRSLVAESLTQYSPG